MENPADLVSEEETGGAHPAMAPSSKKKKKSKKKEVEGSKGKKASSKKELKGKKASSKKSRSTPTSAAESSGVRTKFQLESLGRELQSLQNDNRKLRNLVFGHIAPFERADRIVRAAQAPEVDFTPPPSHDDVKYHRMELRVVAVLCGLLGSGFALARLLLRAIPPSYQPASVEKFFGTCFPAYVQLLFKLLGVAYLGYKWAGILPTNRQFGEHSRRNNSMRCGVPRLTLLTLSFLLLAFSSDMLRLGGIHTGSNSAPAKNTHPEKQSRVADLVDTLKNAVGLDADDEEEDQDDHPEKQSRVADLVDTVKHAVGMDTAETEL